MSEGKLRKAVKKASGFAFSLLPPLRRVMAQGLSVFVFHDVTDKPSRFAEEFDLAVTPEVFRRQVSWIKKQFNVIHPADILNKSPMPSCAAMISFDDGFLGAFENGLPILKEMGIPSIIFLNMRAILENRPIASAAACFLSRYNPDFEVFAKSAGLLPPFHLTLSPAAFAAFEKDFGPVDLKKVIDYQGAFADMATLKRWHDRDNVVYGNHLFDHWNAPALSSEGFREHYRKNEAALSGLENRVNLFAFTNGQPGSCFSGRDIELLKQLGAGKAFYSSGGINLSSDKFLLDRISLGAGDSDEKLLWFRMGRSMLTGLLNSRH